MDELTPFGKSPLDELFEAWRKYELLKLYLNLYYIGRKSKSFRQEIEKEINELTPRT